MLFEVNTNFLPKFEPLIIVVNLKGNTKKQHVNKMSVAKIRMLMLMCGKTMRDRIRNQNIREAIGVPTN